MPVMVSTGISALRTVCRNVTTRGDSPFERAVRTYPIEATSSTAERTYRVMIAPATRPTVSAGSTMWRSHPPGLSSSGWYPDVGSQPSVVENSAISRMPIQKSGTDTPNWLATRMIASLTRPSCSADQMPAGSAISSAMTMPTTASDTVAGSRSSRITVTGSPLRKLTPRSPVSAEPM